MLSPPSRTTARGGGVAVTQSRASSGQNLLELACNRQRAISQHDPAIFGEGEHRTVDCEAQSLLHDRTERPRALRKADEHFGITLPPRIERRHRRSGQRTPGLAVQGDRQGTEQQRIRCSLSLRSLKFLYELVQQRTAEGGVEQMRFLAWSLFPEHDTHATLPSAGVTNIVL